MGFAISVTIIARHVQTNIRIVVPLAKDSIIDGINARTIAQKVVLKECTRAILAIGWVSTSIRLQQVLKQELETVLVIFVMLTVDGAATLPPIVYSVKIIGFCLICTISAWLGSSTL